MSKTALIFGITGQDGAYLSKFLLDKGYEVHGVKRRHSNMSSSSRLDTLYEDPLHVKTKFHLHYGDITDSGNVIELISKVQPDEIYNLAAQSHVAVSFVIPAYTGNVDALGCTYILEAMRVLGLEGKTKFYQASTSELFGKVLETPQTETTPFNPQSPYAVAKQYAFWMTKLYREAYGMYACNGILFNHESPLRGETFVTRKITIGLARIKNGLQDRISLGNLNSKRDWGHARDYVEVMWKMLQQDKAEDFVIATGKQYSVRDFVEEASKAIDLQITWRGEGLEEVGVDQNGNVIIDVKEEYYRPAEVETLLGDATKAKTDLGWVPNTPFESLVTEMMLSDMASLTQEMPNPFNYIEKS
jgi:GDPmannose 4,6-dehydratase